MQLKKLRHRINIIRPSLPGAIEEQTHQLRSELDEVFGIRQSGFLSKLEFYVETKAFTAKEIRDEGKIVYDRFSEALEKLHRIRKKLTM